MAKNKKVMIFIDRDGTVIYDNKYHLGSQKNWKSKVKFLPTVFSGLKLLRKIPNSKMYIVTNQPGIAIKEFPLLNKKRAVGVLKYILNLIKKKGIYLDGYEICGHASQAYTKRRKEFTFNKNLVGNYSCIKPQPGMMENIMKKEKIKRNQAKIYIIGDRLSDVKTALNIKGFGILIPFQNEAGEKGKVRKIKNKNVFVAKNFLDASKFISKREKSYNMYK